MCSRVLALCGALGAPGSPLCVPVCLLCAVPTRQFACMVVHLAARRPADDRAGGREQCVLAVPETHSRCALVCAVRGTSLVPTERCGRCHCSQFLEEEEEGEEEEEFGEGWLGADGAGVREREVLRDSSGGVRSW